jgi:hypothetical protein
MDTANLNIGIKEMATYFANQMKINLGAKVKRKTYRTNWKNGKPLNTRIKSIRANHIASGNLLKSIKVVKGVRGGYGVTMWDYGKYVNEGRDKGKGIPVLAMQRWIQNKGLRPRNLSSGEFKKNTKNSRKAMAFCMNRKIKYFGIEAFPFIEISRKTSVWKYDQVIAKLGKMDLQKEFGVVLKIKR